jgi:hypothetical protein
MLLRNPWSSLSSSGSVHIPPPTNKGVEILEMGERVDTLSLNLPSMDSRTPHILEGEEGVFPAVIFPKQ